MPIPFGLHNIHYSIYQGLPFALLTGEGCGRASGYGSTALAGAQPFIDALGGFQPRLPFALGVLHQLFQLGNAPRIGR